MEKTTIDVKPSKCGRIQFNVGGKIFECFSDTLQQFPKSRLAKLDETSDEQCFQNGAFFFDRNPVIFEAILEACRTGELHMPRDTCNSSFKRELEFWEISPSYLSPCCWKLFYRAETDTKMIFDLTRYYRDFTSLGLMLQQTTSLRSKIWLFLDEPRSSKYAKLWAFFMAFVVIISLIVLSCDSIASLKVITRPEEQKETIDLYFEITGSMNKTGKLGPRIYKRIHSGFHITMITCFVFITFEIIARLICCPSLRRYLKCPIQLCEIVAVVAFWFYMYVEYNLENFASVPGFVVVLFVRILVILQVFRLVRIARYSMPFKVMSLSMSSSFPEIIVLFSLLMICVSLFGWLMYIIEVNNERFDSFYSAMYWALITITTVGYGDYYPSTTFGHAVAGACAISGLVTLALPIGVIAASFNNYYSHHKYVSIHMITYKPYELDIWHRFTAAVNKKI